MSNTLLSIEDQKIRVAEHTVDLLVKEKIIVSHGKIGLGTGTTALPAVKRIAEYMASGKIKDIAAVSTSFQTSILCEALNIPIFSLSSGRINGKLDVTIDGADEIDTTKSLIKGGGAALLREKITAYNSSLFVVIADETKMVKNLGKNFPLPIEIVPEARLSVMYALEQLGAQSILLREGLRKMGPVVTDNGNFILDVKWGKTKRIAPKKLESVLNEIPGVIENGFFTKNTPRVFVAHPDNSVEEL